ncbi:hypothetical protein BT69DRAFT_72070 [Atractiella rhizophila]|nr:hypothetical protein BT69DRAFT_72070 [Atractiella rhizophila]
MKEERLVLLEMNRSSAPSTAPGFGNERMLKLRTADEGGGSEAYIAQIGEGEHWNHSSVFRLPDHHALSPSTHQTSSTPIRHSHSLELTLTYSLAACPESWGQWKTRRLVNRKEVFIASCRLREEDVSLPAYDSILPASECGRRWNVGCVCEMKAEEWDSSNMDHGMEGVDRPKWEVM